jgi:hypothetical protein
MAHLHAATAGRALYIHSITYSQHHIFTALYIHSITHEQGSNNSLWLIILTQNTDPLPK